MKHPQIAVIFAVLAVLLVQSVGMAEEKETSPSDTARTTGLFNPPRVLKPEGAVEPENAAAVEGTVGTQADDPVTGSGGMPADPSKTDKKKGCPACGKYWNLRAGGGGQFDIGVAFLNLDEINAQVRQMGIPALSDNVLILGGKGYGRIGNFIIGGAGYGTWTESSGIPDCCARYARLDLGYGGLLLGATTYGSRHSLMGGIILGGGQAKITRRRNSRDITGWDDAWGPFRDDGPDSVAAEDLNITSEITGNFIAIEPFVSVKYWLTSFIALDFSASYLKAEVRRGQWELDGVKIPDSPETDLGGPMLKLGFHFGV
jgi:hypothetical protein